MSNASSRLLIFFASLFFIIIFYHTWSAYSPAGLSIIPQNDTFVYFQYAKAMAEGHPYRINAGELPSTGSTSHILPFILSLFYYLGATGTHLITASFLFNAACFILFIFIFHQIALEIYKPAALLSTLLVIVQGHTLLQFLYSSDMGVFTLLSTLAFGSLLKGKKWISGISCSLLALTRPEALYIFISLIFVQAIFSGRRNNSQNSIWRSAGLGLGVFIATLILNDALTGDVQFQSIQGKILFQEAPFILASYDFINNIFSICSHFWLGIDRQYGPQYFIPFLSVLLAYYGFFKLYSAHSDSMKLQLAWILAAGLATISASLSNFSELFFYRYFTWMVCGFLLYMGVGLKIYLSRISNPRLRNGLIVLVTFIHLALFTKMFIQAQDRAIVLASNINFLQKINDQADTSDTFGFHGSAGLAYFLPGHRSVNFDGYTSPQFQRMDNESSGLNFERLKHHPDIRFSHWIIEKQHIETLSPFLGPLLDHEFTGLNERSLLLYQSDWSMLDHSRLPSKRTAIQVQSKTQIDSLDIGYINDEKRFQYKPLDVMPTLSIMPIYRVAMIDKKLGVEVGRMINQGESFQLPTTPHQSLTIVLRTIHEVELHSTEGIKKYRTTFQSNGLNHITLKVNDHQPMAVRFQLAVSEDSFTDVALIIPKTRINRAITKIQIWGRYPSFAYWFYQ